MIASRFLIAAALACLMIGAIPAGAAKRSAEPAPRTGTLTLPLADPVITVTIADMALRLRVLLDGRGVIELNADMFDRLALPIENGPTDGVGRIDVPSRIAAAVVTLNDRPVPVTLSTHGTCCAGVDGSIDADLLPYATIRYTGPPNPSTTPLDLVMARSGEYGLEAEQRVGRRAVRVRFSLDRTESLATAAAGAIIAQAQGGRFVSPYEQVPVAFGVARPSRLIAFTRPVTLAGFRFDRLRTRTGDFAGRETLPREPAEAGEIVVTRRTRHQSAWPAIEIGRDRLGRCAEIVYLPEARTLTLRCPSAG